MLITATLLNVYYILRLFKSSDILVIIQARKVCKFTEFVAVDSSITVRGARILILYLFAGIY